MYPATTVEYPFFPPAELRKEALPDVLQYLGAEISERYLNKVIRRLVLRPMLMEIQSLEVRKTETCFIGTWVKLHPVLALLYEIRPVHAEPFG